MLRAFRSVHPVPKLMERLEDDKQRKPIRIVKSQNKTKTRPSSNDRHKAEKESGQWHR